MLKVSQEGLSSADSLIGNGRGERGVTLVEVLAVVTLLGLVGIGIYALTMMPVRAWESARTSVLYDQSVRSMVQRLSHDLANVTPDGYVTRPHFVGGMDRMEFSTGSWEELGQLRRVVYVFEPWWMAEPTTSESNPAEAVGKLLRAEQSIGPDGEPREGIRAFASPSDFIEVMQAGQLRFEYYDAHDHLWLSSWDADLRGWPSAVRAMLIPRGQDETDVVELLFPIFTGRLFQGAMSP